MEQEAHLAYPIQEVATRQSTLTPEQNNRLAMLDWYIDTELPQVMRENKEYGVLQAQWKHTARMNTLLYEGLEAVILSEAKVQGDSRLAGQASAGRTNYIGGRPSI